MNPPLSLTMAIVRHLFDDVTDKAGEPYYKHCFRVMELLPEDASEDEMHAALLHDVLEDTGFDIDCLAGLRYSAEVLMMTALLTREPQQPYEHYITQLKGTSAERIKRADLQDNLDEQRLAVLDSEVAARLGAKYRVALGILNE